MTEEERIARRDSLLHAATNTFYSLTNCESEYNELLEQVSISKWSHGMVYSPAHKLLILEGMIKAYRDSIENILYAIPFTKDLSTSQKRDYLWNYLKARWSWSKKQVYGKKLTKFSFAYKKNSL